MRGWLQFAAYCRPETWRYYPKMQEQCQKERELERLGND
jgi:hypothetical protein